MATVKKAQAGKAVPVKKAAVKTAVKKALPGPYSDERTKALDAASVYGKGKKAAPGYKQGGKVPKGMHKMADGSLMKDSAHKAKDGKWIQKAVNPKHKGYCTPMTKATCTPKRKALAMTFKKMAKARKGK